MGLELIIIRKISPCEDKEIHRFACNWYADLWSRREDLTMRGRTTKISGEDVFTGDQLILSGKHLIDSITKSDNYSEDHLLKLINDKEAENLKLKFITRLTTCSDEYFEEHFSVIAEREEVTKLGLIAKIASCDNISDILYENEIDELEAASLIYYNGNNDLDLETKKRLIYFGLDLIEYGNQGYMGYWSA